MTFARVTFLLLALQCSFACGSATDDDNLQNDIKKLSIEFWHQQLSNYLGIGIDQVKLAQGHITLESSSYQLWSIYNAMSGYQNSIYYNPSQINNFSSGYGMALYNLPVQTPPYSDCDINQAIINYSATKGRYAWDKTINDLQITLGKSQAMTLNASTNIADPSNDSSNYLVTIAANYQHFTAFYAQPYSTKSPQLSDYSVWYSQCALSKAFNDTTNQHWQATFGSKGYMQNVTIAVVVVENGQFCITISKDQQDTKDCSSSQAPSIIAVVISAIEQFVQVN